MEQINVKKGKADSKTITSVHVAWYFQVIADKSLVRGQTALVYLFWNSEQAWEFTCQFIWFSQVTTPSYLEDFVQSDKKSAILWIKSCNPYTWIYLTPNIVLDKSITPLHGKFGHFFNDASHKVLSVYGFTVL